MHITPGRPLMLVGSARTPNIPNGVPGFVYVVGHINTFGLDVLRKLAKTVPV